MSDFFEVSNPTDELYALVRSVDDPIVVRARLQIQRYWDAGRCYLDSDLPQRAARVFRPHFWELYLAAALLDGGVELEPRTERARSGDTGPDLKLARQPVWIEAVSAGPGTGDDHVATSSDDQVVRVPDDSIKLRLRNALEGKTRAHTRYVQGGVLARGDVFVVAVNAGEIDQSRHELPIPRMVRCLFPFGPEQVAIDPMTGDVVGRRTGFQDRVPKLSGQTVSTDCFLQPAYSGVSAVLYACVDEVNHVQNDLANDFIVIYNPLADAPLTRGLVPCAREYWYDPKAHAVRVAYTAKSPRP